MKTRATFTAFALLTLGILVGPTKAEVTGVHFTVTPYVGSGFWDDTTFLDDSFIFGGRAGLGLTSFISLEGTYGYSSAVGTLFSGESDVQHIGGDAVFTFWPSKAVAPYVLGGWGQLGFDPDPHRTGEAPRGKQSYDGWEFGGGLKIRVMERMAVRIEARDVMIERDAPSNTDPTHNILASLGLHFAIGGKVKDSDADGVGDRQDKCPATPAGARVDKTGCPTDADGDGVFDGIDTCEKTAQGAKVDAKGCPTDADADGVFDGLDTCANTPKGARVDPKGCPTDADKDTVVDGIDRCDNTPVGAKVNPDGCPIDSDHDTVYDGIDLCDGTPAGARVDKNGCPIEVSEKETQLLDTGLIRIENINFDTGKTTLKGESHKVLDEVGTVLMQWPQLQIEVGGHCDSRGSEATNQRLSEGRAKAVLDYLQQKFPSLGSGQYTAKGYGESFPVSDNKTELGRAKNRRVEFKVLNTDVLKKEVEKRKMLKN